MLISVEHAEEISKEVLCKFLDAQELYQNTSKLAKEYNDDTHFRNSIRELKCITFEDLSIRYGHMRIIGNELQSSIQDYRWN
jgi:hypothetical protein